MLSILSQPIPAHRLKLVAAASLAVLLSACGGGGGNPGTPGGTGAGGGTGTGNGPVVPAPTPVPAEPSATIAITDGAGTPITSLSGAQSATVRVKVLTDTGAVAAGAIVQFTAEGGLVAFTPESGSALTDATGTATITVKPASVTSAGAVAISANAAVGAKSVTRAVNIAVGAAPLTVGTLSFSAAPAGKLPAFSTAVLAIPVTTGGQPASSVTGLSMTSLCQGDGKATLVQGSLANGVQSATYTNTGCVRGTDTITVAIGNSSQTINIGVDAADIGTIGFVSSDAADNAIVLRGSGGLGRKESAVLTFRVTDQNDQGLGGVDVVFSATTNTGGLVVQPNKATTDASGQVSTTVVSGTIPTPVRIYAQASRNGKTISGLSDNLVISTGLPIQRSLSLSSDSYNIEGWDLDGIEANLTVRMADQYGNPISDSTSVNFVTEGGAVGSSNRGGCSTLDGGCSVKLRSQNFKPLNGRVSVLAYVQGIEDFIDENGDGQYSCTNFHDGSGAKPAVYRPLVDTCVKGSGENFAGKDMADPFLDAGSLGPTSGVRAGGTLDGSYDPNNGDLPIPFNRTSYSAVGNDAWGINYIRAQHEIVFSGSKATMVRQAWDSTLKVWRDWTLGDGDVGKIVGLSGNGCSAQELRFRLHDLNNNPLPKSTAVTTIDADKVGPGTMFPSTVPSTNAIGGTIHSVVIKPENTCAAGSFIVQVTTPAGFTSPFFFTSTN